MRWLLLFLFPTTVFAADVALCDPTATIPNTAHLQRNVDPTSAKDNLNALIYSSPASSVRPWDGTVPPGVASQYLKCADTNSDTVLDDVVEMSASEKATIDAPILAEQARQQAFTDEVTANDLCTAELADIISRVETRRTTLRASVEAQRVTNNTTITNAANNIAGVKSAMTSLNNATAAEFGQTVDELASLATKIAKCVRARAR